MRRWKITKTKEEKTMEIVSVNIDVVKPYWRNPRKNESAVDSVVESIREFGMNVPLVLDKNYVILTGHTRYKALRRLGAVNIPCIIVDLSESDARRFRIADNKAREFSEWDIDKLKDEIVALSEDAEEASKLSKIFGDVDWREMLALSSLLPDADSLGKAGKKTKGKELAPASPSTGTVSVICPHCLEDNLLTQKDFDQK
jgi:ParB-like chromosome segregation protein Spo0J